MSTKLWTSLRLQEARSNIVANFRHTIDLFVDVINHWDTPLVERNMSVIEQAIKTSLYDADPQARENARRTFQSLQSAFPKSAEFLVQVRFSRPSWTVGAG